MTAETCCREIEDRDIEQVVALWHAAGVSRPWNDPNVDLAFARRNPHSTVLVMMRQSKIIATAMIGEDGHRGWVYYVATLPELRGQGIGRQIMAAAEEWLQRRGVWKVQLLVRADNTTVVEFYEHLGYRDTQTTCLQKVLQPPSSD